MTEYGATSTSRRRFLIAALLMRLCTLLFVAMLLVGCQSYFRVTDPQTGRVYYADKKPKNKFGGAVTFEDMHRATKVTLQLSVVTKVSKGEANTGRPPWEPIKQDPAARDVPEQDPAMANMTRRRLDDITRRIVAAGGDTTALEELAAWFFLPADEAFAMSGIRPSPDPLWRMKALSDALRASGESVDVPFNATGGAGARVRYRVITDDGEPHSTTRLTNDAEARMSCGLYYIWTERGGKVTSSKDAWFTVAPGMALPVDLDERKNQRGEIRFDDDELRFVNLHGHAHPDGKANGGSEYGHRVEIMAEGLCWYASLSRGRRCRAWTTRPIPCRMEFSK